MKSYILFMLLCVSCLAVPSRDGGGRLDGDMDYFVGPVWSDADAPQDSPWYIEWALEAGLAALGLGGLSKPGRKAVGAVARAMTSPLRKPAPKDDGSPQV